MKLPWLFLEAQHIGVGQYSAYSVAGECFLQPSVANGSIFTEFQQGAKPKLENARRKNT